MAAKKLKPKDPKKSVGGTRTARTRLQPKARIAVKKK